MKQATHYDYIRDNNRKLIRTLLRSTGQSGKSELVTASGLSFPTVSTALNDLTKTGEVLSLEGSSTGGRPGAIFQLNPEYRTIVCAILDHYELKLRIYDACGNLLSWTSEEITETSNAATLVSIFSRIKEEYPNFKILSFGIPGVALNGCIRYLPYLPKLENVMVREILFEQLGIEVFLENDINSIVLGELEYWNNFAHLFWNQGCIGSGIVLDGQLIRGNHGCAGELEYICDEKAGKIVCLKQAILALSCVIDVPDIAISGEGVTEQDIPLLEDCLKLSLPEYRMPQLHFVANNQQLYQKGLWQLALDYCISAD